MKRWIVLGLIAAAAWSCSSPGSRGTGPARSVENGVEVVSNGAGVFPVTGQPWGLALREEFRIDQENAELTAAGLSDIRALDVDSQGRIYLFQGGVNPERFVYQLDAQGHLLKSFCPLGQGPGEVEFPFALGISPADEVRVFNGGKGRLTWFDPEGRFLRDQAVIEAPNIMINSLKPLANGNFLAFSRIGDPGMESQTLMFALRLYGPDLSEIKSIRTYLMDWATDAKNPFMHMPIFGAGDKGFAVNWGDLGNEIALFDLDGRMTRLIRADFPAVPATPAYKAALLERVPRNERAQEPRKIIEKMELFPPFQALLFDDQGRLYAVRSDKDEATGMNVCEVFSPDGVRILRTSLGHKDFLRGVLEASATFDIVLKKDRFYCIREKENGFKEVVVYAMDWSMAK